MCVWGGLPCTMMTLTTKCRLHPRRIKRMEKISSTYTADTHAHPLSIRHTNSLVGKKFQAHEKQIVQESNTDLFSYYFQHGKTAPEVSLAPRGSSAATSSGSAKYVPSCVPLMFMGIISLDDRVSWLQDSWETNFFDDDNFLTWGTNLHDSTQQRPDYRYFLISIWKDRNTYRYVCIGLSKPIPIFMLVHDTIW